MEKSKLLRNISQELDIIKTHINRMSKEAYSIHELDKDLLMAKTRELYDYINSLKVDEKEFSQDLPVIHAVKEEILEEIQYQEEVIETKFEKIVESLESKREIEESFKETYVEEDIIEEVVEEETIVESTFKEVEPILEDKQKVNETQTEEPLTEEFEDTVIENTIELELDNKPESQIIEDSLETNEEKDNASSFDLFSTNSTTISDKFVGKDEKSLADKLQESPLEDLRTAIGINEKFLFINELFNGDMGRYNKIIDELNSLQSKTGLDTYLMELKIEKQWSNELEAYIKFKEITDRKFK